MEFTWGMLYERADGCACNSPELRAKDEARYEVGHMMIDLGYEDPEGTECPEDVIEDFCDAKGIKFDEYGSIIYPID